MSTSPISEAMESHVADLKTIQSSDTKHESLRSARIPISLFGHGCWMSILFHDDLSMFDC